MRAPSGIAYSSLFALVAAVAVFSARPRLAYIAPLPEGLKKDFSYKGAKGLWLEHSDLKGARLQQAGFYHSSFNGADLTSVQARGLQLVNVQFNKAVFKGADLRGLKSVQSSWRGADLRNADLRSANFYQDIMTDCDLRGADLRDAVLLPSTMEGAIFDATTRLPFSREVALMKGMKDVTGREATSQSAN